MVSSFKFQVSSLLDFVGKLFRLFRRLNGEALDEVKPPVNKVSSLRDFCRWHNSIIFHPLKKSS